MPVQIYSYSVCKNHLRYGLTCLLSYRRYEIYLSRTLVLSSYRCTSLPSYTSVRFGKRYGKRLKQAIRSGSRASMEGK